MLKLAIKEKIKQVKRKFLRKLLFRKIGSQENTKKINKVKYLMCFLNKYH